MASRTIRIHLGAHKTASTHIQEILERNRPHMASDALAYWPLVDFRRAFRDLYDHRSWLAGRRNAVRRFAGQKRDQALSDKFSHLFDIPHDILISEENLIGQPGQTMSGRYYQDAAERLSLFAQYLPEAQVEIFLSLRNYPDFLASCYGEALAHGTFCKVDDFVEFHREGRRDWTALINVIRGVFPKAKCIVWRYEDFRAVSTRVMERLTGLSPDRLESPPQALTRSSASGRAIEETIKSASGLSREELVFEFLSMQSKYPRADHPRPFDPWPRAVADHLASVYAAEVDDLAQRSDLEFLWPDKR